MTQLVAITANTSWYLYNFRKNLILRLLESGYRVVAIAPRDAHSDRLAALGCDFEHIYIDQGGTNPAKDVLTALAFFKLYQALRPSVVLNFTPKNNIYSTLAAARFRIPVINNIAGLGSVFINEGLTTKIARLLYKVSQKYASKIFFQNEEDRELFLEARIAPAEITDRLPGSGVDLKRFTPSFREDDGTIIFIMVARMLYEKGISEYVEAARILKAKYPHTEFRLLGFVDSTNPSAISIETIKKWHADKEINYLGTSDFVEAEMAQADCVVLPSYYREGVPKSLLEGGAMAKPLVTTDNVGCRETIREGFNGFICQPRSARDLIRAMEEIIVMSYSDRIIMGNNSRKFIEEQFDEAIVLQKYLDACAWTVSGMANHVTSGKV